MEPRLTQPYSFDDDESESIGQGFAKRLGDVLDQVVACCGRAGRRERLDVGRRGWDLHEKSRLDALTDEPVPCNLGASGITSQNPNPGIGMTRARIANELEVNISNIDNQRRDQGT